MSLLEKSVAKNDDGTWTFACPGVAGSACGADDVPFSSVGWPTRKIAEARGQEHFDDHRGIAPTSSLEDFRAKHGLTVNETTGGVTLADLEA